MPFAEGLAIGDVVVFGVELETVAWFLLGTLVGAALQDWMTRNKGDRSS